MEPTGWPSRRPRPEPTGEPSREALVDNPRDPTEKKRSSRPRVTVLPMEEKRPRGAGEARNRRARTTGAETSPPMERPPQLRPTARPMQAEGVRSPQVLPELFGGQVLPHRPAKKPRGENGAEALPIFPRPPSIDGVVWPDGRRNRHENQPHGPCRRGEAEPPRVGYGDGAPRGNDKATAFAAMLVRVTMSAQCTGD